ncbi:MAG: ABC transporter permease subunit, partial [Actinobacteria bacterium]|nr:ABC transporter permease subunit [Actinomycetota bacterium]
RPALWASSAVVFLFCFTSFGIVRLVGGPSHPTLEVEIWRRTTQSLDLRTAAALAVVQLVIVVGMTVVWSTAQARTATATAMRTLLRPRRARTAGQRALVWITVPATTAVVLAPLAVMVERSMCTAAGRHSLDAWRAVTGVGRALGTGGTQPVVADPWATVLASLRIALVATCIALVVGTLAACAIAYARRGGRLLDAGLMLPLGTSAVTIGFGLIITYNRGWYDLRGSWVMLPIGQALVAVPFVVRVILPTMRAIQPGLREAAATLGASPWHVWREVDLPVLRRSMGAGAGFAFAISVGEFGASSFLTRVGNETAPIAIGRLIARPSLLNLAQAYALATVLAVVTLVVIVVVDRLRGERGASF